MTLYNNWNTFYTSPKFPSGLLRLQTPQMTIPIPLMLFPNYTQLWNNTRSNPFNIDSPYLQTNPNSNLGVFPTNPFSYTNYLSTVTKNSNRLLKWAAGLNVAASGINALSGGTTNTVGNIFSATGDVLNVIPGAELYGGIAKLAGAGINALIGTKLNDANIKAMNSAIKNRNNWLFGDNSNTDALIAGSLSNVDLNKPGAKFYGKEGLLNRLFGTGKTYSIRNKNNKLIDLANLRADNTEELAYKDYLNNMIRQGLLSPDFYSLAALGGLLNTVNKYNNGGSINTPRTHGGLFSNGLVEINNGGSHELNPYLGVLFGVDEYGIPNLVEEGETVFKDVGYGGPDNYSFSDRITFDIKKYGKRFNLGGLIKNKKKKKYTFADISKYLAKDANSNPNGEIILRTNASNQSDLANIQEEVKAERMLSQMNPLDIMAALQQSPMGEQMMGGMQEGMDLQAMMEQQLQLPMMAAYGGKLFGYGGNIYADAGLIFNYRYSNNPLSNIPPIWTYTSMTMNGSNTPRVVSNNVTNSGTSTRRNTQTSRNTRNTRNTTTNRNRNRTTTKTTTTKKGSNYWLKDKNTIVSDLPEIAEWHNEMFGKAINNYIAKEYQKYQEALDEKNYDGARNIASNLQTTINNINKEYVKTVRNPSEENTTALQTVFDNAGLNININTFLNEHKGKFKKTSGALYDKDKYIDGNFGAVSKNRYISDFNENSIKALEAMEIARNNYYGSQQGFAPEYQLGENDLDLLKNLSLLSLGEDRITKVVRNPNYVEGGNEPEFIPVEQDIQNRFAPKDLDAATWWEGLTDNDRQGYYNRYGNVGDPTRTGVYDWQLIVNLSEALQQALVLAEAQAKAAANNSTNKGYFVPKPRNDWESGAALAVALRDYADAYFGAGSKPQNPGIDAAYSYLSRVGNIPMVRSHPTGTKMTYRPTDLNYEVNNVRNDTFGMLRAIDNANMNHGYNVAATMAALNQGRTAMGKAKQQAFEDNIKNLQAVLSNNNTIDLENAKNSLAALTTNAQNLARARETQALVASGLASLLAQNYNNWLNYRNSQSSGLALMLYDMGYNKLILNLKDLAFLLLNQQPDVLNVAGVLYKKVNDQYT